MEEKIKPKVVVRIDSLAFGGDGVGRCDGQVVFVAYAAPGDLLEARVIERKKSYLKAQAVKVIEPGPVRRRPRCPYFGECGGCAWQHVEYGAQLEAKSRLVAESLKRIGGVEAMLLPIVPSPNEFQYRNRVRLHLSSDGEVGYFARGSRRVIGIKECPILEPSLAERLPAIARRAAHAAKSGRAENGRGTVELYLNEEGRITEFRTTGGDPGACSDEGGEAGPAFHQVNRLVNKEMVAFVRKSLAERRDGRAIELVDLYCGDGNLSLPLTDLASHVVGFDLSARAVELANAKAKELAVPASYVTADIPRSRRRIAEAVRTLSAHRDSGGSLLCVIADPPRSGLRSIVDLIAASKPELFIYISCNPPALARDARLLSDAGFRLEVVQPFDMFPQTFHVETVALFSRP